MPNLILTLINASERAACVARSCCTGSSNEVLLVAEKFEGEANARFERDFKTIADVLAQEVARTEIASSFPDLAKYVRGEECPEIAGVRIEIKNNIEETTQLLKELVAPTVAKRMAEAAHNVKLDNIPETLPDLPNIDTSDLSFWIDPIDATAEFIAGVRGEADADRGLSCVTVLIGAYQRTSGEPVMGVINQPFYDNGKGRVVFGINVGDYKDCSEKNDAMEKDTVLLSGAENPEISAKLKTAGFNVMAVPGAGHKLLKVAIGEAAAYIVSKGTTFHWDTCGPHSILQAKGGDLISFKTLTPITYNTQQQCNNEGIIAYSDINVLERIKTALFE